MELISKLVSYPWWYYVLAIVLGGLGFVGYVFYRGYSRVRPKPLKGLPCPPLTHSLLGHPEGMAHPLKHDIRLQFSENFPYALYQLCLMNHTAIFVNDPAVVAEIINTVPTKGPIYGAYRYDQSLPDALACDGDAHELRKTLLHPAFQAMPLPDLNDDLVTRDLLQRLSTASTEEGELDMKRLYTLFALDTICKHFFNYNLSAVNGSPDGDRLYNSLTLLYEAAATNGIYAFPSVRKITPEELNGAKDTWRAFLHTLYEHIQSQAKEYEVAHPGDALLSQTRVDHALVAFQRQQPELITQDAIINEIHQILRHGHESILGSLLWLTYVLRKNKRVRGNVEKAILQHEESNQTLTKDNYPPYLEAFIKELLRRYPALGNMTVRTVNQDSMFFAGFEIPRGSPLHLHMYSLQNTARNWIKPKEFLPERWCETSTDNEQRDEYEEVRGSYPKCPFLAAASSAASSSNVYEGAGFQDHSLSYFPFSAGDRTCLGRHFALQIIRKVLYDVSKQYRLNAVEEVWEEDVGISLHTVVLPYSIKSTTVRVVKIDSLKDLVEKGDQILAEKEKAGSGKGNAEGGKVAAEEDDGWADDNDFDFVKKKDE